MQRQIILASGSERRKDIFEFLGIPFEIVVSDFPEESVRFEDFDDPRDYVSSIAMGKTLAVSEKFVDALIIGADTSVFLEKKVFNKPGNLDEARVMLQTLRGKKHEVVTAVVVRDTLTGEHDLQTVTSSVEFLPFSDQQLEEYIATGESLGKAGSYAIQMGAKKFVRSIEGSLSNIVGLPIEETVAMLESFNVPIDIDVKALILEHFSFEE